MQIFESEEDAVHHLLNGLQAKVVLVVDMGLFCEAVQQWIYIQVIDRVRQEISHYVEVFSLRSLIRVRTDGLINFAEVLFPKLDDVLAQIVPLDFIEGREFSLLVSAIIKQSLNGDEVGLFCEEGVLHDIVVMDDLLVLNITTHELPKDALLFGINGPINRSKSSFADLIYEDISL